MTFPSDFVRHLSVPFYCGAISRLPQPRLSRRKRQPGALQAEFEAKQTSKNTSHPESDLKPQEDTTEARNETEIARRRKLLADYKAVTGNPSNKRIYEATNSGIYKPEFYKWLSAELSSTKFTTSTSTGHST